ncbi:bifunctional UDP-N-acetylglucosamine pyrophosphorylase / Glucosamine-1-phosphate N-acetyltransferase [Raineyella antarctica]|uniref:Bifunctional protein GlmU n=1 Tax=Raineyella antarctica TaxID=1577474 RepID=A0A1G6GD38_9ACTN|nr:bifunctional UDP-N-acetylglucosamine pyrophosphorylase / Glucosamine-1-phosphate N-acetyltransferase [Raineyella antarctica]
MTASDDVTTNGEAGGGVAAVVVLAAGAGTRMKSSRSKVLHEVAGRSMLSWAVDAAEQVEPEHLVVVVGHQREQVEEHLREVAPAVITAVQDQQNGTGHAVMCGLAPLGEVTGTVIVTYGDVPLLSGETLVAMVGEHRRAGHAVTVLTARVPDPTGYGRIVRGDDGGIARIVEHKDASEAERAIDEINSGIYVFDADILHDGLASLGTDNAQGELYLTDVIGHANSVGRRVGAYVTDDLWQTEGVNNRLQLARMGAEMNRRIGEKWMLAGVTIIDPATTWIEDSVDIAPDVTLMPGTHLHGATSIATGAVIGPDTSLKDVEVGEEATITRSQGLLATVGARCQVGPYAYLRPGTELAADVRIGPFVETKRAVIGRGASIAHQGYVGDVEIGARTRLSAGTIVANDDGETRHSTTIGADAFVGANSVLVAPVSVADGAHVAAGSIVTEDVAPQGSDPRS